MSLANSTRLCQCVLVRTDPYLYRVVCENPECDYNGVIKTVRAQYLGDGVYQAVQPRCARCNNNAEMRILDGFSG